MKTEAEIKERIAECNETLANVEAKDPEDLILEEMDCQDELQTEVAVLTWVLGEAQ
jgi:hypothetical protein